MRGWIFGVAGACLAVAGCANAHENGVDAGAPISVPDTSLVRPDAWDVVDDGSFFYDAGPGFLCGASVCAPGLVCCNPTCGLCVGPGVDCIDVECADAGAPRACGGLISGACDPSEYCDYPSGAACGGTDEEGVCRPRPLGCLPADTLVCGCDGNDYPSECAANASGTDLAHGGSCHTTTPVRSVSASQSCAPFDGPAWEFDVTPGTTAHCDATGPSLRIALYGDLSAIMPNQVFTLGPSTGAASACPGGVGGPPCTTSFTGTVTIHSFDPATSAVISYDLRTPSSGTSVTGNHLPVSFWCPGTPGCG